MNATEFKAATGRDPQQDDLDRANCKAAVTNRATGFDFTVLSFDSQAELDAWLKEVE